MDDYWLRALRAAEEAEEAARRLRRRWGRDAEAHLADAETAVDVGEPRRTWLEDVRKALRWT
jgi:hypothetical protein